MECANLHLKVKENIFFSTRVQTSFDEIHLFSFALKVLFQEKRGYSVRLVNI